MGGRGRRWEGKAPFMGGSNVIPGNLSFSVYAASYFTLGGHDAGVHQHPSQESKLCAGVVSAADSPSP